MKVKDITFCGIWIGMCLASSSMAEEPQTVFYADSFVTHSAGFDFINVSKSPRKDGIMLKFKDEGFAKYVKLHLDETNITNPQITTPRLRSFIFSGLTEVVILKAGSASVKFEVDLNESRLWTETHPMPQQARDQLLEKAPVKK